jgi:GNAT superfamily N-acetyltransferase
MTFDIRRAQPDDADAIADVYLASFRATYDFPLVHTDDQVRSWIRNVVLATEEIWVALDKGAAAADGPAAAVAEAGAVAPAGASGNAEVVVALMALTGDMIDQLYVAPGWTGRGIGSRLMELAKTRRPDSLDLYTFQVNVGARRFYERHGFVEVWRGDGSQNEEGQPDVKYSWRPAARR